MSIKNLFGSKPTIMQSANSASVDVESPDFLEALRKQREEVVPPIDFLSASNYVRFGSAKEYYAESIKRIYNTYPYDGSGKEKIEFDLSSSYLDRYILEHKYPKHTGYAQFSADSHIQINRGYNKTTVPSATKISDLFSNKDPLYDSNSRRKEAIVIDFDEGLTLEWWMKRNTKAEKEALFYFSSSNGSYIQLSVRTADSDTNGLQLQMLETMSSTFGLASKSIVSHNGLDQTALIDNQWHQHALSLCKTGAVLYADYYYDGLHRKQTSLGSSWQNITGSITLFIASGTLIQDQFFVGP